MVVDAVLRQVFIERAGLVVIFEIISAPAGFLQIQLSLEYCVPEFFCCEQPAMVPVSAGNDVHIGVAEIENHREVSVFSDIVRELIGGDAGGLRYRHAVVGFEAAVAKFTEKFPDSRVILGVGVGVCEAVRSVGRRGRVSGILFDIGDGVHPKSA